MSTAKKIGGHVGNAFLDKIASLASTGLILGIVAVGFAAYSAYDSTGKYDDYAPVDAKVTAVETECWWQKIKLVGGVDVRKTDRMPCDEAKAMEGSAEVDGLKFMESMKFTLAYDHPNGTVATATRPLSYEEGKEPNVGDTVSLFAHPTETSKVVSARAAGKSGYGFSTMIGGGGLILLLVSWFVRRLIARRRGA